MQINGRNVFTIEYDRDLRMDTLRNSIDEDLLGIQYNEAGQISGFIPLGESKKRFAALTVMYDTHGRQKKIIWNNESLNFDYDRHHRITAITSNARSLNFLERYSTTSDVDQYSV